MCSKGKKRISKQKQGGSKLKQKKEQQSVTAKPYMFFSPGLSALSIILALCNIYGYHAVFGKSIDFNLVTLCEICFYFVVWYGIFYSLFALLTSDLIAKRWTFAPFVAFKQHIIRNTTIVLALFWLGHLIIKYPSGNSADSYDQILQGMGYIPLTRAHPVFHTMLLTGFIKFGLLFGSKEAGAFLFVLVFAYVAEELLKTDYGAMGVICSRSTRGSTRLPPRE